MRTDSEFATRDSQLATSLATANEILLAPYALDDSALQRVFGQILTHQVDYADLYFQYSRSEGWSLEEGIVKAGSFAIDQGVGVRAVSGEKTAFAYSDDISLEALRSAAQATRAIARQGGANSVQELRTYWLKGWLDVAEHWGQPVWAKKIIDVPRWWGWWSPKILPLA